MMRERIFRFKQFSVVHERSAMKVGVDGVLIGAWARVEGASRILDVGAGCGLVALMCAQRNPEAQVVGVEIDAVSAAEMRRNVKASSWHGRIEVVEAGFETLPEFPVFDAIVSNPPFFDSGVMASDSREVARHAASLSPLTLIAMGNKMLTANGTISMICPPEWEEKLAEEAEKCGMFMSRKCLVRGLPQRPVKRMMAEFAVMPQNESNRHSAEVSELILHKAPGEPTEEYISLCRDFYLKF